MSEQSYVSRAASMATRLASLTGIALLAACGEDTQVPTAAAVVAGGNVSATVASLAGEQPSIRVTDAKGKGVRNVMVRWRVTSGGGRVTNDSVRTSANGDASSGGWVLGTTAGQQTLTASADGVPTVTFTATALPGPVSRLVRLSADNQIAEVGTPVAAAPSVRAEDQYANTVPNVAVTFSVTAGNGSVTGETQTTNAQGVATAQAWTLGTQTGQQIVRATALNATAAVFGATATAGAPTTIVKQAGDNQQGAQNAPVAIAPGVRVTDRFGNPVGNVPVTFTPGTGSGTVSAANVSTDPATGTAFVGSWTLGTASTQTLVATSSSIPNQSATFTATAVTSLFDIDVRFVGTVNNPTVRQAFLNAAAKWRSVIVGDLHRTTLNITAGRCGVEWLPALNETINDVVIYARIGPIDSAGSGGFNTLGRAGPCFVNTTTNLPAHGYMEFDEYDLDQLVAAGQLTDVIVHEMGHVLGIGTLWNFRRTLLSGEGSSDPFFTGVNARQQFAALNTVTYSGNPVPVENTGGDGTRDSHWRESILTRELMTGFLNRSANPLSRLSVGSLADLGYQVSYAGADAFSLTAALRYEFPFTPGSELRMHNDVHRGPIELVTPDGRRVGTYR